MRTSLILLLGLVFLIGLGGSVSATSDWWDSNWDYRMQINITNNNITTTLQSGYTVSITFNHQMLVSDGKSLAGGDDVRVTWYNPSSETEVELDRISDSGFNLPNTNVLFKTQADIPPSSTDSNYYIYYGNPGAGSPPTDQNDVFMPGNDANTLLLYHFEDGSGTNVWDSSGGTNYNGTASGGSWVGGFMGGGYRLDNGQSDYIDPGTFGDYPTGWTSTNESTIEFWFYPINNLGDNYQLGGREGGGSWTINFYGSSNKLKFYKGVGTSAYSVTSKTSILANQWYHIVFTWGSRGQEIWINGVKEDTNSNTDEPKDDSEYTNFRFGQGGGFGWDTAGGIFDGLRVSDVQRASFPYVFSPQPSASLGSEESRDTTPPNYTDVGYNNTKAGQDVLFSAYWQDDFGLSTYIFSWNNSGVWVNESYEMTGTGNWSNITKTLTGEIGADVGWRIVVNDTSGNTNDTGLRILRTTQPDVTPPQINITSPTNTTFKATNPYLNVSTDEPANLTYNWDGEGDITGCLNCTEYNVTYGEQVVDANTSLLLHFNENFSKNAHDSSPNGNNGTIVSADWIKGRFGTGIYFNGTGGYVEVSDSPSLSMGSALTILAWINIGTPNVGLYTIAEKYNDDWGLYRSANKIAIYITTSNGLYDASSTATLSANSWYCVAGTYNGSELRAYVNAESGAPTSATGTLRNSGNFLRIGGGTGENPFNGRVDEVHILNRALDREEIYAMCNKTMSPGPHKVSVYAIDAAGNSNSSTVYFGLSETTPPEITIVSPKNTSYNMTRIPLEVSANEPIDTWMYNLNDGGNVTFTPNTTIRGNSGLNTITVYVNDTSGNTNSTGVDFTISLPLPDISYDPDTNEVTIIGYTRQLPANFSEIYRYDKAGTLQLMSPRAPNTTMTLDRQIQPAEELSLRITFNLSNTDAWKNDKLFVTGTDKYGELQNETIDVSDGDGNYTTKKSFKTITSFDAAGFSAGNITVTQSRWGVISSFGLNMYMMHAKINILPDTYFTTENEQVTFDADVDHVIDIGEYFRSGYLDSNGMPQGGSCLAFNITDHGLDKYRIMGTEGSNPNTILLYDSFIRNLIPGYGIIRPGFVYTGWLGSMEIRGSVLENLQSVYLWENSTLIDNRFIGSDEGFTLLGAIAGEISNTKVMDANIALGTTYYSKGETGINNLVVENSRGSDVFMYWTGVNINLTDISLNNSKIKNRQSGSTIREKYSLDIKVQDMYGNPILGANVSVYDKDDKLVFSQLTNLNGSIDTEEIIYATYDKTSGQVIYSPHKVVITKSGYPTYTTKWNHNKRQDWIIALVSPGS